MLNIIIVIVGISIGGLFSSQVISKYKVFDFDKKKDDAKDLIEKSEDEAAAIKKEGQNRVEHLKQHIEDDHNNREVKLKKIKDALSHKGASLNKKEQKIEEIKLKEASYKEEIRATQEASKKVDQDILEKLANKSGTTAASIKEAILKGYEDDLRQEGEKKLLANEEILKENANKRAQKIVINTMQRLCVKSSVENRSVTIKIPKDQIKGKIVGKNGKNIKYFEELLDVAVVFNDQPNTISLSAFQLVLKRTAERALKKLVRFRGPIDEKVIKRIVNEAKDDTDKELFQLGSKALKSMGITDKGSRALTIIVGRLEYRTSYGQNIMKHSMEVGWVAQMLGSEIGLDTEVCRVGGFLHDLGKAIDQDPEIQESHDKLSKDLMEKFGFSDQEVHAAWTHHDAIPIETPEALIVKAADSVSGGRPGARQDTIERYIEKMKAIDDTIQSFDGIKKSFAMSAGREVRVYVDPDKVVDKQTSEMAFNIARKIEQNVVYPGKIRVKVIRRTKATDVAK